MDDYDEYYFDDAVGGSEDGYSGDQSNYDSNFDDWNFGQDTGWDYTGGNQGNGQQNFYDQNPQYDPSQQYYQDMDSGTQFWKDQGGNYAGYQEQGGQYTPYDYSQGQSQGGMDYGAMFDKILKGSSGMLNTLFAPQAGGQAGGMDVLKGLSPFLAALYNKNQAPKNASAANQYIQQQQQAVNPFAPYRQEAAQNMQASNSRLNDLINNRNLSPQMLAQDALSRYTTGRSDARSSNRFNNGRTLLNAGLANQRNLIGDEMKLQNQYAQQAGAGFSPNGLSSLLGSGLAANQAAASPWNSMFAALGQMNNNQSPNVNPEMLQALQKFMNSRNT